MQVSELNGEEEAGRAEDVDSFQFAQAEIADLAKVYKSALGPLQISTFDSNAPRAYNRCDIRAPLSSASVDTVPPTGARM